jgi:Zn-dependent protease with chaperone function
MASPVLERYGTALRDELVGALSGRIAARPVPARYRLGLALAALGMVLLLALYLGLVALVGWGLFLYLRWALGVELVKPGRGWQALGLALPVFVGLCLIWFLVRPLWQRSAQLGWGKPLDRKQEPLLYAFVERLCDVLGAPRPRAIYTSMEVNAGAALRRGVWSLFADDLVLVIGLPLVSGLSAAQLAGVLAHELGHFAQRGGMRFQLLLRSINGWFQRVASQDEASLFGRDESAHSVYGLMILTGGRWVTRFVRRILWLLMKVGHAMSAFLSRQMEHDADAAQAALVGARVAHASTVELLLLGAAYSRSIDDLNRVLREGVVVDDLPALTAAHRQRLPAQLVRDLATHGESQATRWYDTHPSWSERRRTMEAAGAGPVRFASERPAAALFRDFPALCRTATRRFVEEHLDAQTLATVRTQTWQELLGAEEQVDAEQVARQRFFQGTAHNGSAMALLPLGRLPPRPQLDDWLAARRTLLVERAPGYRKSFEELARAAQRELRLDQASALTAARVPYSPTELTLPPGQPEVLARERQRVDERLAAVRQEMAELERQAAERFAVSLALLRAPESATPGEVQAELPRLLAAYRAVVAAFPKLEEARREAAVIAMLWRFLREGENPKPLVAVVVAAAQRLIAAIHAVADELEGVDQPFAPRGEVALRAFVVPVDNLEGRNGAELVEIGQEVLRRAFEIYFRVLGRLAALCEDAEERLGLPPLPEPPSSAVP